MYRSVTSILPEYSDLHTVELVYQHNAGTGTRDAIRQRGYAFKEVLYNKDIQSWVFSTFSCMPVTTVEITQIFFSQPFFDVQRELRFFFFKVYSISTAVETNFEYP